MSIFASILRSVYKLSGAKKAFALPEDALRKEIEKQNRHRGVFTPTDRKTAARYMDAMKGYRELVEKADDIGDDNPMAYNELFVAPYAASEKKIPPTAVQEMMRRSLYHIKWYFAKTDLNTDKGKAENKRALSNTPNGTRPKRKRNTRPPSRWILSGSRMRVPVTTALPAARFAFTRRNSVFPNSCRCSAILMK